MTTSIAIEAGVLGAASVLGVSKLYDMEANARRWPDSAVVFGMLIAWGVLSVFALASALLSIRGVELPGAKYILLGVVAMTFLTHALKRVGLLKTTVVHDDHEGDAHPPVDAVARAGPDHAHDRA